MESIRNKVALIGAGCSKFGENRDKGFDDLLVEAAYEACEDAGIAPREIQAAWIGYLYGGNSGGMPLGSALKLPYVAVSRIENACATGLDAFRSACFAIASGVYDICLVVGVEKLTDGGVEDFPEYPDGLGQHPIIGLGNTYAGAFALLATRYLEEYKLDRNTLAKISVKNHYNGSLCPGAYVRRQVTIEEVLTAPMVAWPLGSLDCCPITDGAAAVLITSTELAKNFRDDYALVSGLGLSVSPGRLQFKPDFDFLGCPATVNACKQAYKQAQIKEPLKEIDLAMVHNSFTICELISYEDLGFCRKGEAKDYVDSGVFSLDGELPVNTDGGLQTFGHPVGATGVRMIYEIYKQLQGKADGSPERQVKNANVGLAHTLGGEHLNVSSVCILSKP